MCSLEIIICPPPAPPQPLVCIQADVRLTNTYFCLKGQYAQKTMFVVCFCLSFRDILCNGVSLLLHVTELDDSSVCPACKVRAGHCLPHVPHVLSDRHHSSLF